MYFPPRMFPGFLGPEALKLSVTPAHQAELVCFSQQCNIASCGSRVLRTLVGVWGEQPQRSLLIALKIVLENTTVKILESEKHEFRYMLLAGVRENGESPTDTA